MIKVKDVKYAVYGVRDIDAQESFMLDFGLVTTHKTSDVLYMRGTSRAPYIYVAKRSEQQGLIAIAMEADSEADFLAAEKFVGSRGIEALDGPGAGRRISFDVPGGLPIELVYGIADMEELPLRRQLPFNAGIKKERINSSQRPPCVPAQVLRLGHIAVSVVDALKSKNWLSENFGMIVSDTLLVPGTTDLLGFFIRCDRGDEPTDHHTLLVTQAHDVGGHHISFEVEDLDSLQMGSEWLKSKGRAAHWGVGRHVVGSQIFDYWWDPEGNRIEHYTDGDRFNNKVPSGTPMEATDDKLWLWGPAVPEAFFTIRRQGE